MITTYDEAREEFLSLGFTRDPDGGWWKSPYLKDCAHKMEELFEPERPRALPPRGAIPACLKNNHA